MYIQLSIMLICVLLCILPPIKIRKKAKKNDHTIVEHNNLRVKYILPLCFIGITTFFAIRYDYGLDYWNYFDRYVGGWTQRQFDQGSSEALFYIFMSSFPSYFSFIIAHTMILMISLFYLTRKYCDYRFYALFFFILLAYNDLGNNMISALRSSMAASMMWIGLDFLYIRKRRWIPLVGVIVLAFFFHTSAIVFLILPLMHVFIMKVDPKPMFIVLCLALLFRLSLANVIFGWAGTNLPYLQTYEHILSEKDVAYNINSVIYFSCMLFPAYYICQKKSLFVANGCPGLYVLAVLFFLFFLSGLDFEGRFSIYLMIFYIYALSMALPKLGEIRKAVVLLPIVVFVLYNIYMTYTGLTSTEYLLQPGNPLFYKTIFETTPM